jgi:NAD-dependent deacetylase
VPNAAHAALARLGARCAAGAGVDFTLITQNVDDLHERAGSRAVHMHGELAVLTCERCGRSVRDLQHVDAERFVPCGGCGHDALRPGVVWFGEVPLHLELIEAAMATCTHFLAIGTSGAVWPAAGLLGAARQRGAATFVQALEPPHNLDARDRFFAGRAAEVVPPMCADLAASLGV